MSKWWSTTFAVLLVLIGLATARQPADDDDDDFGSTAETVLNFDWFHQEKSPIPHLQKHRSGEPLGGLAFRSDLDLPVETLFHPFLIPASAQLALVGLLPRAPAAV